MNKIFQYTISKVCVGMVLLSILFSFSVSRNETVPFNITIPTNFPKPIYDLSKNPITQEGFELGKKLFYDGILSRTGIVSCGSCHQASAAFIQADHDFSHGVDDQQGRRNALPIFNALFRKAFFWDGGVPNLDFVPANPIENPLEMDEKMDNVLKKLNQSEKYRSLFKNAFGTDEINTKEFLHALSQFMAAMISANSRYDKYVRNEGGILSLEEMEGLKLFKTHCSSCHATDLFTDDSYRNNGLSNSFDSDKGREEITLNINDRGKFKVPSLRNIAFTGPYMHDGRFETLEDVLNFYNTGVKNSETLDPLLKINPNQPGIHLTPLEQKKIIAFLQTLSDQDFLNDKRFAEPENH